MKRDTGRSTEKAGDRCKIGAGVPPKGVFKRIADAERNSGIPQRIRHTNPENLKK
jgi:hypothetical protein